MDEEFLWKFSFPLVDFTGLFNLFSHFSSSILLKIILLYTLRGRISIKFKSIISLFFSLLPSSFLFFLLSFHFCQWWIKQVSLFSCLYRRVYSLPISKRGEKKNNWCSTLTPCALRFSWFFGSVKLNSHLIS